MIPLIPRLIDCRGAKRALASLLIIVSGSLLLGCPTHADSPAASRSPRAQKWYERALRELAVADVDAANDSARHALELVPGDEEVRVLAATVALARLEYDEVLRLLRGIDNSEASALRGRAYWYKGDIEQAARALEKLLDDPDVKDGWAKAVSKLAHRGTGRKPFDIHTTDGRLETVQMARVPELPLYVVPVEIDGDKALALISTGNAEVMLDSATRREPSWVSLRFGRRLEVKDVPALTQDLTDISMKLGVPIKALLGANLLRHLNATLDHRGRQFVARSFVPPPPPFASRMDVHYMRGGGMLLGCAFSEDEGQRAALFVDSSMSHSVALDRDAWKRIGVDATSLPLANSGSEQLRAGTIPLLRFGAFKLPQLPAVYGPPVDRVERELKIDVDGVAGAGLLSAFRLTFSDNGRVLWVEQRPPVGKGPGLMIPQGLEPPKDETPTGHPGVLVPPGGSAVPPRPPTAPIPLFPIDPSGK